jgi:hypothetical protein
MSGSALAKELRTRVEGRVIEPADPGYDVACEIWNRLFERRPAVIVRPATASDVGTAVALRRRSGRNQTFTSKACLLVGSAGASVSLR